jgi:UDP-3-O-[3-hydroxymyristoyl] N-acetylglucosamine deacetylase
MIGPSELGVQQTTINRATTVSGVGLHTGELVTMALRPAAASTGIVFRRVDQQPVGVIRAHALNVVDTHLATTLQEGDARISTVEHLLAALSGLGIDNAEVDVDAPELPIMDGSAAPFVFTLQSLGTRTLSASRRFLRVVRPVEVAQGDARARLSPWPSLKVSYTLLYDHPVFLQHAKEASVEVTPDRFVAEVCRARTFGFMADFERLRALNLARGGSLDNAVVVDDHRVLNEEGLRQHDEFVKHKVLDAIGDLALLGMPLLAHFEGHKSGHGLNNLVVRRLLSEPDAFEIVEMPPPPVPGHLGASLRG